ncbi:MAG: efflux RND transporter periplasmic adaptor subunit [Candidatus Zixiibacteriota bacterium]|nr:MAG: efflux RND transporter periplasmic adaptor subunit [candidate division Zixibacteria bacterium]
MKYIGLMIACVAAVGFAGCGNNQDVPGGSGLLEATETIVSAETSGRIQALRFDEGMAIGEGDTLLVIDTSRPTLDLASAEAGRKVATAQLGSARVQLKKANEAESYTRQERDRIQRLFDSGTSTKKQLDQLEFEVSQAMLTRQAAQANVATIKAELDRIDADIDRIGRYLEDCYPVAPVAGVVTEKYVEQGELVKPGDPIARISQLGTLWVKVYLPAGAFARVKLGDAAVVDTETGGKQYDGRVVWASEEAEFTPKNVQTEKSRASLVYAVKVQVDNPDGSLKIGMPVYVTIGEQ